MRKILNGSPVDIIKRNSLLEISLEKIVLNNRRIRCEDQFGMSSFFTEKNWPINAFLSMINSLRRLTL
jgi:hypothetical protein